jgi:hypothetical protein
MSEVTERFERGPLDRPQSRWRIAFRRLPVTLSVLAVVTGGAAGLAYVASGSGVHRFSATLRNDLGQTVIVGSCEHKDCKKDGVTTAYRLAPGQSLTVGFHAGSVNPILVTTQESKRLGCFFLRYATPPARAPVIRLSEGRSC